MLLAALAIGFFVFHVWFRTYALTEGFAVAEKRRELSKLESEVIEARLRKNRVMGPQSLKRLTQAYRYNGIIFEAPEAKQVFYYRDGE